MVKRITIVGSGLMGGSLAIALRPSLTHLAIVDADLETVTAVQNLADTATQNLGAGLRQAELIVLATPVRSILRLLEDLPDLLPGGCLLLDLGSTKREICRAMEKLPETFQAIGGHPMCGKETAGFNAAAADLYQGRPFILCRNGRTTPRIERAALEIVTRIGGEPLFLPAEEHDALVGLSSHLPYLVAALLMRTAASQRDGRLWRVSATGFRDTTRLAGSDPKMMLDILLTNRETVLDHLDTFQNQLAALKNLLHFGGEADLAAWLAEAKSEQTVYKLASGEK